MRTVKKRCITYLPIILTLLAGTTLPQARGNQATTLHVEVQSVDEDSPRVSLALSMDVLSALAGSLNGEDICTSLLDQLSHEGLDLRSFWQSIREGRGSELLSLDADQKRIRAYRQDGLLHLTVEDKEGGPTGHQRVKLTIPESLLDLLLATDGETTPEELLERLRSYGAMTLVSVEADHESVRIWLE